MTFPMMISKGRVLLWSAAFVLLASPARAADFSGLVVSVLDGDTIEVLHNTPLSVSISMESTALRKAKPSATELSRLRQP